MWKEFKEFVVRGNVVDLAVGIVIGVAFGKIITSLVEDILMPPVGLLLGKVDFANLFISLSGQIFPSLAAAKAAGAPTINYGVFLNTVINFVIVAFVIFILIRRVNRTRREKPPDTKSCSFCASNIPIKATRCPHCTSELKTA